MTKLAGNERHSFFQLYLLVVLHLFCTGEQYVLQTSHQNFSDSFCKQCSYYADYVFKLFSFFCEKVSSNYASKMSSTFNNNKLFFFTLTGNKYVILQLGFFSFGAFICSSLQHLKLEHTSPAETLLLGLPHGFLTFWPLQLDWNECVYQRILKETVGGSWSMGSEVQLDRNKKFC